MDQRPSGTWTITSSKTMSIEIIAIGDEVVNGYTINENGSFIAKQLLEAGFCPSRQMAVGDEQAALKCSLQEALSRAQVVITTGGLGPTCDDHTKQVAADLFQRPLELSPIVKNHQRTSIEEQSIQPKGAILFQNDLGTAWGFALEGNSVLIALPGVPSEMRHMFPQVTAYLKEKFRTLSRPWVKVFHFLDTQELRIDPILRTIETKFPHVHCGIYPALGSVTVRLTVAASTQEEADRAFASPQEMLLQQFHHVEFKSASGKLDEAVHEKLLRKNLTLATAESCTGGALASTFTSYPGASSYFLGSVVAYANPAKEQILSVDKKLLETKGAVSIEVACQMAENARALFGSDIAIGVSGIFGPSGGSLEKPIGTVCAAIAKKQKPTLSWTMHFQGNRLSIREKTIQKILAKLYCELNKDNQEVL
jgi:nicotinamide-nucleotide amidase